jgi:hypothetical protein
MAKKRTAGPLVIGGSDARFKNDPEGHARYWGRLMEREPERADRRVVFRGREMTGAQYNNMIRHVKADPKWAEDSDLALGSAESAAATWASESNKWNKALSDWRKKPATRPRTVKGVKVSAAEYNNMMGRIDKYGVKRGRSVMDFDKALDKMLKPLKQRTASPAKEVSYSTTGGGVEFQPRSGRPSDTKPPTWSTREALGQPGYSGAAPPAQQNLLGTRQPTTRPPSPQDVVLRSTAEQEAAEGNLPPVVGAPVTEPGAYPPPIVDMANDRRRKERILREERERENQRLAGEDTRFADIQEAERGQMGAGIEAWRERSALSEEANAAIAKLGPRTNRVDRRGRDRQEEEVRNIIRRELAAGRPLPEAAVSEWGDVLRDEIDNMELGARRGFRHTKKVGAKIASQQQYRMELDRIYRNSTDRHLGARLRPPLGGNRAMQLLERQQRLERLTPQLTPGVLSSPVRRRQAYGPTIPPVPE